MIMGQNNYELLKDKKYLDLPPDENENFKKKYYALIRDLSKTHSLMCERCPIVKSCCGGCHLLKTKINKLKNEN